MTVPQNQSVERRSSSVRQVMVDVFVEAVAVTIGTAGAVGRSVMPVARPLADLVLRPPLVGTTRQPATWLETLVRRGELHRHEAEEELATLLDRLVPLVYEDLRRVAHRQLDREGGGHTLQTTALIHEAYLKLASGGGMSATSRAHFLAIAARAMRQVLVDYARRRKAAKRGGGVISVTLGDGRVLDGRGGGGRATAPPAAAAPAPPAK